MGATVGANSAGLRALARAVLDKTRAAREGGTAASQVSYAGFMRGTAENVQTQQDSSNVPLSHALGLGRWDTSANQSNPAGGTPGWDTNGTGGQPYAAVLAALRKGCPEIVDTADWLRALRDAERFLPRWGTQARARGWTARDLFGLHPVPQNHSPAYRRLSRYEHTGLIWLLHGCPVIALTEATAAIQNPSGAITIYRKHNKPALGPTGDSLDDLE
jgi:hypothetical protein